MPIDSGEITTDSAPDTGSSTVAPPEACPAQLSAPHLLDDVAAATWLGDHWPAELGHSVALAGRTGSGPEQTVLLGAPLWDGYVEYTGWTGRAFLVPADAPSGEVGQVATSGVFLPHGGPELGQGVFALGDVDGDGHADVVVRSNGPDDGSDARIYHGPLDGLAPSEATARIEPLGLPNQEPGHLALTRGSVGARLWIPTWNPWLHPSPPAEVWGIDLPAAGEISEERVTVRLVVPEEGYNGLSVAASGDLTGDGEPDLLVLSRRTKRLYVVSHNVSAGTADLSDAASFVLESLVLDEAYHVQTVGDLNGDGLTDFALLSPDATHLAVRIYLGPLHAGSSLDTPHATFVGEHPDDDAGHTASTAGDFDGDGVDDLLIGAPGLCGRVYLFRGPIAGALDPADAWVLGSPFAGARAGWALDGGQDVNNDGYDDFLVGAPHDPEWAPRAGKAYLIHGRPWTNLP